MKIHSFLTVALVLVLSVAVSAQQSETEQEITRTVLNYAEGWYEGDAAKMESALLPELAKRRIEPAGEGRNRVGELTSLGLVQMARTGYGKSTPKAEQKKDVKILDIFRETATVRLEMRDWVDYMHLAKYNGKWLIVNVLWDLKPRNTDGKD
ncbi:MAG: nuclear transport factor 2 family protein [Aridibacter famidurans]|nr:nuclear transport factor 2 family protein [Aridibacter famidurans]